jgi:hypothetical protein
LNTLTPGCFELLVAVADEAAAGRIRRQLAAELELFPHAEQKLTLD